jgi:hypothetical protein
MSVLRDSGHGFLNELPPVKDDLLSGHLCALLAGRVVHGVADDLAALQLQLVIQISDALLQVVILILELLANIIELFALMFPEIVLNRVFPFQGLHLHPHRVQLLEGLLLSLSLPLQCLLKLVCFLLENALQLLQPLIKVLVNFVQDSDLLVPLSDLLKNLV